MSKLSSEAEAQYRSARADRPVTGTITNDPEKPLPRREIFCLDEGEVVISYPVIESAKSYEDFLNHLDLFAKKMHRGLRKT